MVKIEAPQPLHCQNNVVSARPHMISFFGNTQVIQKNYLKKRSKTLSPHRTVKAPSHM